MKRKTKSGWAGVPVPSRDPRNFPAIISGSLGRLCSLTALLASTLQVVLHAHLQMHVYLVCFYILQVLLQIYSSYFPIVPHLQRFFRGLSFASCLGNRPVQINPL